MSSGFNFYTFFFTLPLPLKQILLTIFQIISKIFLYFFYHKDKQRFFTLRIFFKLNKATSFIKVRQKCINRLVPLFFFYLFKCFLYFFSYKTHQQDNFIFFYHKDKQRFFTLRMFFKLNKATSLIKVRQVYINRLVPLFFYLFKCFFFCFRDFFPDEYPGYNCSSHI